MPGSWSCASQFVQGRSWYDGEAYESGSEEVGRPSDFGGIRSYAGFGHAIVEIIVVLVEAQM